MQDGVPLPAGPDFQEIAISLADTRLFWLFNEHPMCRTAMVVIVESVPKRKHKFETTFAALMSRTAFERTRTWFRWSMPTAKLLSSAQNVPQHPDQ